MPQTDEQGNLPGYTRMLPSVPSNFQPEQSMMPPRNATMRFNAAPIPGLIFASPDQLRGFHLGSMIPQYRTILPAQNNNAGGGGTTGSGVFVENTSSTETASRVGIIQSATFNVPTLSPGSQYTGSVSIAGEGWQFYGFTCSYPMRVRAYGTLASQTIDLTRPLTQGPGFGTQQDIIWDVNLDTAPPIWDFSSGVTGVNNDEGQSQLLYLTITNNTSASAVGFVTITYAPTSGFAGQL